MIKNINPQQRIMDIYEVAWSLLPLQYTPSLYSNKKIWAKACSEEKYPQNHRGMLVKLKNQLRKYPIKDIEEIEMDDVMRERVAEVEHYFKDTGSGGVSDSYTHHKD